MRVLVACEESQTVCMAFRARGHVAYSCDVLDCSGGHPEWHIKGDVLDELDKGWDLIIAHPPCTYLSNSGVRWLHEHTDRWPKLFDGAQFFKRMLDARCEKIAVENPVMHKYAKRLIGDRRQSQTVQPYEYGHLEQKATCLWLKGLPLLKGTDNVKEEMKKLPDGERQKVFFQSPGPDRARLRSKTYQGIADAMAWQWGDA